MLMIGLLFALGWITDINQYWILLFNLTTGGLIALNAFLCFPKKRYFTVESIEQEITLKQRKAEQLIKKQKNKLGKKRMYE